MGKTRSQGKQSVKARCGCRIVGVRCAKARQAGAIEERKPTLAAPRRVINLMEALRRSVAEDKKPAAPRTGTPAAPARKRA